MSISQFWLTLAIAHPFTIHRIALTWGALTDLTYPYSRICTTRKQSTLALTYFPAPFRCLWQRLISGVALMTTHGLRYQLEFSMRCAWKTGCGGGGRSPEATLWERRSTACSCQWPTGSTSGETTSSVDTRIPRSRRPIAVEDYQKGDESSYSITPPTYPGGNHSLRIWEGWNHGRWPILRPSKLFRWLT